ncbi:hypothetical protein F5Y01DRAFT_316173 [Xylaria sp. FL0043]|nr:hypothetical protein F5Y01DRAFT_316173 [Xylaria sp. FL0043]
MTDTCELILEKLSQLCILYADRLLQYNDDHLISYMSCYSGWLGVELATNEMAAQKLDNCDIFDKAKDFVLSLTETPAAAAAKAILKVMSSFPALASGRISGIDLLLADNSLFDIDKYLRPGVGELFNFLPLPVKNSQSHSRVRVLDLSLVPCFDAIRIYTNFDEVSSSHLKPWNYTFAAHSEALLKAAQKSVDENFTINAKGRDLLKNIEYAKFDIGRDLSKQSFQDNDFQHRFDLIITTEDVLDMTSDIHKSLSRLQTLLSRDGALLIHIHTALQRRWLHCILGVLPNNRGEEGRRLRSPGVWEAELLDAKFRTETIRQSNSVVGSSWIVAKPMKD